MYYICFDTTKPISFLSSGRFIAHNAHPHPKRNLESAVLLLGYNGECALAQDGREYLLEKGAFQFLFPNITHYGTKPTTQDQSHFWCHFYLPEGFFIRQAENIEELEREGLCILPEFSRIQNCEKYFVLFSQLIDAAQKTGSGNRDICNCYVKIILLSLAQQCRENEEKTHKRKVAVQKAMEWLRLHSSDRISVRDVAAALNYNPDYLTQLFKADAGMTLCEYINYIRLANAKNLLLNTNLYVSEIAYRVGFTDEKYFMKLFLKKEHVTPTQYRNSHYRSHINNE